MSDSADLTTLGGQTTRSVVDADAGTHQHAADIYAADTAACLFHGFSDITRTRIVQELTRGEHNVRELTEHVGLSQATVSGHLNCLYECGVVDRRPKGRATIYSLAHPAETLALLQAAQDLLAATGNAVTLCPNHGLGVVTAEEIAEETSNTSTETEN